MSTTLSINHLIASLIILLATAALVLELSRHIKPPFTVLLVIVGVIIAQVNHSYPTEFGRLIDYRISSDFILYVCLPTLLFEASSHLDVRKIQHDLRSILNLAVPGLIISTFLIGIIVSSLSKLDFINSLLLGAILSATDPVAVIAIFKTLGAPKRLTVLLESESLFNDATSVVAAKLIFAILISGLLTPHQIGFAVFDFVWEFLGGIAIGWFIAVVIGTLLGKTRSNAFIEISLTTILAYSSFIIAQDLLHVSGVMATVAAGLTMSAWGHTKISPGIDEYIEHFWDYLSFVVNALIFLLVGLSVDLTTLLHSWQLILIITAAMLLARLVVIFGFSGKDINWRYKTIMFWGGMRGAIAIAIVFSLGDFPNKDLFIALILGVVLFTIIVKGLTVESLVHWLKLDRPLLSDRLALYESKIMAAQHGLESLETLQKGGFFSNAIIENVSKECEVDITDSKQKLAQLQSQKTSLNELQNLFVLRCLASERSHFQQLFNQGHISEYVFRRLRTILEQQIDELRSGKEYTSLFGAVERQSIFSKITDYSLKKFFLLARLYKTKQSIRVARDYEIFWALFQGTSEVVQYIDGMLEADTVTAEVVEPIRKFYLSWQHVSGEHLDGYSAQFPEFVMAMQQRMVRRSLLISEITALKHQLSSGIVMEDVATQEIKRLQLELHYLREGKISKIQQSPTASIQYAAVFKSLSEQEFLKINKLLKHHLIAAGETIGTKLVMPDSLLIIGRGVVRVVLQQDGKETQRGSLIAGDIIHTLAAIETGPVIYRAITPCEIYELAAKDIVKLCRDEPAIAAVLGQHATTKAS